MVLENSQDTRLQENHGLQNFPWGVGGGEVNHICPLAYECFVYHFQAFCAKYVKTFMSNFL